MTLAFALSACVGGEVISRRADSQALTLATQGSGALAPINGIVRLSPQYTVRAVEIDVPALLEVSEANVFFPIADIVWRGEPIGNRHAQVQAIFADASQTATADMSRGPEVIVAVEVTRFHCLTEKTRYTVGGTHTLHFNLTVRDAATGVVLDGPRAVVADVKAAGGAAAIAEEQAGRTQRVVIVERLAQVLRRELSAARVQPAVPGPEAAPSARLDSALRLTPAAANF